MADIHLFLGCVCCIPLCFVDGAVRKQRKIQKCHQTDADETLVYGHFTGGFSIGGDEVRGSLILLPRSFFAWSVDHMNDLTEESLALLWVRPCVRAYGRACVRTFTLVVFHGVLSRPRSHSLGWLVDWCRWPDGCPVIWLVGRC